MSALYDRLAPTVLGICRRILQHDADGAEDAALDAFVQVWHSADRFDAGRGDVLAWVASIARTRAIDRLRARGSRIITEDLAMALEQPATGVEAPEQRATGNEQQQKVQGALQRVSPSERRALSLAFYAGLSHREIAERTRQPLGTVKTQLRSGMLKLRRMLAPLEAEAGG